MHLQNIRRHMLAALSIFVAAIAIAAQPAL
jgi:hypothetical protein